MKPRFCKSRPIPFALREQVEKTIQKQVADGELEPVDSSDWAAPIVVVTKKMVTSVFVLILRSTFTHADIPTAYTR